MELTFSVTVMTGVTVTVEETDEQSSRSCQNPALEPRSRALQVHLGGSFRRLPVEGNFERSVVRNARQVGAANGQVRV